MSAIKPKKLELLVTKTNWENPKILKVDFKVNGDESFNFHPGQHITIVTDTKVARQYSIYDPHGKTNEISMIISAGHEGVGANYFKKLKKGDIVTGLGPLGRFTLSSDYVENTYFAASGVGGVPLLMMAHKLLNDGIKSKVRFYIGFRYEKDTVFEKELEKLKDKMHDFDYVICYSRPEEEEGVSNKGYVADFLKIEDPDNTQLYICGVGKMVEDTKNVALKIGMAPDRIIALS